MSIAILTFKLQENLRNGDGMASKHLDLPSFFLSFLLSSCFSWFFLLSLKPHNFLSFFLCWPRAFTKEEKAWSCFVLSTLSCLDFQSLINTNQILSCQKPCANLVVFPWSLLWCVGRPIWLLGEALLASNLFAKYWLGLN